MDRLIDPLGARTELRTGRGPVTVFSLRRLEREGVVSISHLPYTIKVLLEGLLRNWDAIGVREDDVAALGSWPARTTRGRELAFIPARLLLQDFTGVPSVVDLAALRSAMARFGEDPSRITPRVPADLVVDHSVQVDAFGTPDALAHNERCEFERNEERYQLLRWAQRAIGDLRVVPPGTGIVHQINLEQLAKVVQTRRVRGEIVALPDSVLGTDSHTTMINGLGIVGWGVGGIEAEAVMLGEPYHILLPDVVGLRLSGALPEGTTTTDLALTITETLRGYGVKGRIVEFYGPGVDELGVPDRATISSMAPEYAANVALFPVDEMVLRYLERTARGSGLVELVELYTKEQGLFRTSESPVPAYSDRLEFDLSRVKPSLAGPKHPHSRVELVAVESDFRRALVAPMSEGGFGLEPEFTQHAVPVTIEGQDSSLRHGSVTIAAIDSCTNTGNPTVMVAAGLLAKKAVDKGLSVEPHVKTSISLGSHVAEQYLAASGLLPHLEALGFYIVSFGCGTCIGHSGPLPGPVAEAIEENDLITVAVTSANRNFEGRVHRLVRAHYLASPPLVVAYALAGNVEVDLTRDPLGFDNSGRPVFLRDLWPSQAEVGRVVRQVFTTECFERQYNGALSDSETWECMTAPKTELYGWDPSSTYVREPPFFEGITLGKPVGSDILGARVLALLGDSVTTDHISPSSTIPVDSPAGRFLRRQGVEPSDFSSYGSRRGNHEVMVRGTYASGRIRNRLVPGVEGGVTLHLPTGERMSIYDAAMRYKAEGIPLLIIAGEAYGTGSSRDWAAKGTYLLGVKAVLAESFERIHRKNLVGMGILPLEFAEDESAQSLGLTGREGYDLQGLASLHPGQEVRVSVSHEDGTKAAFSAIARIDSLAELTYYQHGGILQAVLRDLLSNNLR